jgi:DNA-binding transcriptional MerR regulator
MWENRYSALQPKRSDGNIRFYNNYQLQRLLNIVNLQKIGFKISHLCSSDDETLHAMIKNNIIHKEEESEFLRRQNSLIMAGISFDNSEFEKCCIENEKDYGLMVNYTHILLPMLQRIGLLWNISNISIAQEHFITHHIKRRLYFSLTQLQATLKENAQSWVLFLPEDEFHDIGLLMSSYLLSMKGCKVIYLGSSTPLSVIRELTLDMPIDNILSFWVRNDAKESFENFIHEMQSLFLEQKIFIAAKEELLEQIISPTMHKLSSINDLVTALK